MGRSLGHNCGGLPRKKPMFEVVFFGGLVVFFFGKHLFQEGLHLNIDAFRAVESCLSNGAQRLAGGACCFPAQPQAGVFAVVSGCFFPLVSLLQGWM